jgi:hypothetical protein
MRHNITPVKTYSIMSSYSIVESSISVSRQEYKKPGIAPGFLFKKRRLKRGSW